MGDLDNINLYKHLINKSPYFKQENSHGENVNIIIVTRKKMKSRKKHNVKAQQPRVSSRSSRFSKSKQQVSITRHSSMPELNYCISTIKPRDRSGRGRDTTQNKYKLSPLRSNFIVNVVSTHRFDECLNPFEYPKQTKFQIYRCDLGGAEDNCCCSCNSDAMFEIMKSLYECYKKKDCRNCTCILCSHLQPEDKLKLSEKEKLLREKAMKGLPLPEGKTTSEIKLILKVRTDLGVPIEPTTKDIRDKHEKAAQAGKLLPLQGKTLVEKEKILQDLHDMGIPLPVGRTPSEKALIAKITGKPPSQVISMALATSRQMSRAKAEGLFTPLKGKTPEEREKILRRLAMIGLPLPEGQTPSENKLINKVRADLGLPVEPKTKDIRDKHEIAAKAGKLLPLEGKTPAQKEKILKGLHDMNIPLPVGRTPSEKFLIAKIATSRRGPSKVASAMLSPSEQLRRAKAEGLLTSLKGKTPKQREKILKGLAMKGLPLPEAQSPSEKKLIKKVRTNLGVPIEPKTKAIRKKHEEASKAGKLLPLEGKTPVKKKKILQDLHDMGIPLPVGRTPSEKALIAEITGKTPTKVVTMDVTPSEQMLRAKAEGLLTPLKGKTPEQKEKILKELAMKALPLPEAQSPSEKNLIDKVRADLGLPKEPTTKSMKYKHEQAAKAGLLQPLEGKTPEQKEKILKDLRDMGIPLPEGRTPSEKALIEKVKTSPRSVVAPSEQLRKAKAEGLLTPLKGKPPEEQEKIVKGLAMKGLPLPEAQSPSEKKLIDKVRSDLGLPKYPTTKSMKDKHEQAAKAGLLQPLEGKTPAEKEKVLKGLRALGIPLPEGRTPSEKALIEKIKAPSRSVVAPSEQLRRAKAEGLLTPLKGKPPEEQEKIVKGLAMKGLPLPEAQSPSEKKLIDKVRSDLGLPTSPTTKSMKDRHEQAAKAGLLQPLEGKTPSEKAKVLKGLRDLGIPLPKGRTPSEKALIGKVKELARSVVAPSEQLRKAKTEGLLTPLKGKTPEHKEKIVKGLAMKGLLLPEAQSPSEKKLIDKVRADLGLPKEPTTKSMKDKHEQAAKAGLLQPLEGKTPLEKAKILKGLRNMGIPLPKGRSPSEKALIAKVKTASSSVLATSEQLRRAKAEGLLTPLKDKTQEEREKVLKGLAMKGLPLPEGQTPSQKKLIERVRADLGLPLEPKTKQIRDKHEKAAKIGKLLPLEGKTPAQKEKILKGLHDMGIPLPVGRTPSEKSLIAKIAASPRRPSMPASALLSPSELMRRAKAEGLLTSLKGKPPDQQEKIVKGLAMKGMLLPEAQSQSEKKLIDKVRADLGLPKDPTTKSMKEKHQQATKAGLLQRLEGKTPTEKAKILKGLHDMGIPLPTGRSPSEKALIAKVKATSGSILAISEQLRRAKAEGLLTPLKDKTPEEREKILTGLAMKGIPLPEGLTPSEKVLIDKVRADLGLPIEPKTKEIRDKHKKAAKAGKLLPLEGKTPAGKEKILKGLHDMGIPLPVGRTPSEKSLIAKIAASPRGSSMPASAMFSPSELMRRAKAEGLLTSLKGKPPDQQEKILKGLAMKGLLLPDAQSPSEKKLIDKVRADLGLPKDPTTKSMKEKHKLAFKAGLLQPLEGKTPTEKAKILKGLHDMGIPLPKGRSPSEKALIAKVKTASSSVLATSEQLRRAKVEGLLTPLKNKTPEKREKILKGLAMKGLPLPEGQTPSEKKLIEKVRADLGLPIEPKSKEIRDKHEKAAKAGKLLALEGKTPAQKEKILKGLHDMRIPLPVGRTPSEKSLIAKIAASPRGPSMRASAMFSPSELMRRAKAEGLLTSLKDKAPDEREKILKGLAMIGLPLPEGQTPSEKNLIEKVRFELGVPIEPTTKDIRNKHEKAAKAGKLLPLEGKTSDQKGKILKGLHDMDIPLPVGRTPSEKSLIAKIAASPRGPSMRASVMFFPSELMRKAKAEGLLTSLKDKAPDEREKFLKGLAMIGLPLPEGQTPSEKNLIEKVRFELGVPIEPTTKDIRNKHEKAAKAGKLLPLEGKTSDQKVKILKGLHDMGIPLPVGRTPSEKYLIAKIAAGPRSPSKEGSTTVSLSQLMRKAKAEGLLISLKDKAIDEREKVLKGLAMKGIPLPEGQTPSEKSLIDKVRADLGLPIEPKTKEIRDKHEQAAKAGKLLPLEGKMPAQKEKILKGLHDMGIPLPVGRTPSEKSLIAKIVSRPRSPSKEVSTMLSPSEQMRRAKAEGLVSPLKDKAPAEREKHLKKLAMMGLPLPEGQTSSERSLIDKVRADLGLPIEPKTKDIRHKHEKAAKAGKLLPLEGKTQAEKEKILQDLHDMGIPLAVGRTPSEEALIAKITGLTPSEVALTTSKKMSRAKAEGLLTPLKGKTPEKREKILRALAMIGLPLPEGQTLSENKIISKVRGDLGLPIEPQTKDIRDKHEAAAVAGKLLPLEGKTSAQKEKILKGLHGMGIPLPIGRTPSEKALIAKIMAISAGTAVGVTASKELATGITESLQDITKTTKCDRACGCDKKKIRFKHSYVKIRVTSPDISSFCDCSYECIPGVKNGVFIDSDGIKVTVGSAVGIPSFITEFNNNIRPYEFSSKKNFYHTHVSSENLTNRLNYILSSSSNFKSSSIKPNYIESENMYLQTTTVLNSRTIKSDRTVQRCLRDASNKNPISKSKSTASSVASIVVLKSEMSLNSTISNMNTVSLTSVMNSIISSSSTHYSSIQSSVDPRSSSSLDESSTSDVFTDHRATFGNRKIFWNTGVALPKRELTILRMSQTRLHFENYEVRTNRLNYEDDPIVIMNDSKLDVSKIINKIMSKTRFADASSIYIVIPTSDDEEVQASTSCLNSIANIDLSETDTILKDSNQEVASGLNDGSAIVKTTFVFKMRRTCLQKSKKVSHEGDIF